MQPGCFIISSMAIAIFAWVFLSQKETPSKKVSKINELTQEAKQISLEVTNSTTTGNLIPHLLKKKRIPVSHQL